MIDMILNVILGVLGIIFLIMAIIERRKDDDE